MKLHHRLTLLTFLLLGYSSVIAAPIGTAFVYQGRLAAEGIPANGDYQLRFGLYDAVAGGTRIGTLQTNTAPVANGIFTTTLDFGPQAFNGEARWLEIGVRTNGAAVAFTLLLPRQPVAPAPNALFALRADTANTAASATAVSANGVTGASLQPNSVTSDKVADGTITAADLSSSLSLNTFWRLSGNAGTTPGPQFLGTTDNRALEMRVNNQRFLRAAATTNSPSIVAGAPANYALPDADGVAILGGGQAAEPNIAGGGFSFIGGGRSNVIHSAGLGSAIVAGRQNEIYTNVWGAFIGAGDANFIDTFGDFSVIAGGANNLIAFNTPKAGILAGEYNLIGEGSTAAAVTGGADNWIQTNSPYATIPGGLQATAMNFGQMAYASGMFGDWGDAQTSLFVLRGATTNAVTAFLFLDGAFEQMRIPLDGTWMFQMMIVARSLTTGGSACFKAEGGIKNVAGTLSLIGGSTQVTQVASEIAGLSSPQVLADNVNDALSLRVFGVTNHRIRWVARVQTVELKF